ncbi:exodeoxyribonuclease V subunit alpha [Chitinimonas lacunae]|uniref:RecBCD enzyme subunit RecD n=1 Tax=Chitinimonas lacunae TaxID=1963018 RepID=A0ABV8MPX6_9NEIS
MSRPAWLPQTRPLTRQLIGWLASCRPCAETSLAAAALALEASLDGHVCLRLDQYAGRRVLGLTLPPLATWRADLLADGVCRGVGTDEDAYTPLVLDGDRLYLTRLWWDETRLVRELRERAGPSNIAPQKLKPVLDRLFPGRPDHDGQRVAAATALLNRIAVISGGPGTGKTSTVARVLAALLELEPDSRIGLAAPTGKAAARMVEALRGARAGLALDLVTAAAMPDSATTLHRLLGFRPDSATPRHHREQPLALDALVVDEASMVDLAMFAHLLDALPSKSRLILLGDRDQLASVEPGAVFAELSELAGHSPTGARRLSRVCTIETGPAACSPLSDGVALLRDSYRFHADSGVGALARHANSGDAAAALALLQGGHPDLALQAGDAASWWHALLARLRPAFETYRAAVATTDPASAFAAFQRLRVLCALRDGPTGVAAINRLFAARLMGHDGRRPHYPGEALIIRRNDPTLGLWNGDIGLTLADGEGGLRVWFERDGGFRALSPYRLPQYEPAYAMTVHQSQGSEFDEVLLILPDEDSPVLTRSLIYTAITRARRRAEIWGRPDVLARGIERGTRRVSGLGERLSFDPATYSSN